MQHKFLWLGLIIIALKNNSQHKHTLLAAESGSVEVLVSFSDVWPSCDGALPEFACDTEVPVVRSNTCCKKVDTRQWEWRQSSYPSFWSNESICALNSPSQGSQVTLSNSVTTSPFKRVKINCPPQGDLVYISSDLECDCVPLASLSRAGLKKIWNPLAQGTCKI